MKNENEISELRQLGFYQLKKLLGLGDERLRMILQVGEVKPLYFTDAVSGKTDVLYPFFAVKNALIQLQGKDVQLAYETKFGNTAPSDKMLDVKLRLMKKRKHAG